MKYLLAILGLFVCGVASADNLFFSAPLSITFYNSSSSTYLGDDVHCPALHLISTQRLTGYPTQNGNQQVNFSVPANGSYVYTGGGDGGLGVQAITYGAPGAIADWTVQVGADTVTSQEINYCGDCPPAPWGSSLIVYVDGSSCNATSSPPPCETNLTWTIKNNSSDKIWYYLLNKAGTQDGGDPSLVPPGGTFHGSLTVPCSDASNWAAYPVLWGGPGASNNIIAELSPNGINPDSMGAPNPLISTNGQVVTVDNPTNTVIVTPNPNGQGSLTTPKTPVYGVPQSNILWSSGSSVNDSSGIIATLKDAASVAHDDIRQVGASLGGDLTNLASILGNSNLFNFSGSNYFFNTNSLSLSNYASETTLHGMSNLLSMLLTNGLSTNGAGTNSAWTNGLTNDQLTNDVSAYQDFLTNSMLQSYLAQVSSLTNRASVAAMGSIVSSVQGLGSTTVEMDDGGTLPESDINLGHGIVIQLGTAMPSYGSMRTILAWTIIVSLFCWNWRTAYLCCRDAFTANQARTAGTEMFGSNLNMSSALLTAIAIFACITAIPVLAVSLLSGEVSILIGSGAIKSLFAGFGFGYQFLEHYIPIATLISAVIVRLIFQVTIQSLTSFVMGIKLFLVGL